MKEFDLLTSNIENLYLKLKGEIPIDRDELLALVNSWGRDNSFYTSDKDGNEIEIIESEPNEKYDLSKLDVSKISNFDSIFYSSYFNSDISKWNVSNATFMNRMFTGAKEFNQDISNWDVSKTTFMYAMFYDTTNFNQDISMWNVSKVTDMSFMFAYTKNFNSPLDKWNVSKVTSIRSMFSGSEKFNQPLNSWDISKVINMDYIFSYTNNFNQPLLLDLSHVENCGSMFEEAKAFKDRFNNGNNLPYFADEIKKWLKENKERMIALDIKENKSKDLDNFLSNINVIDSTKLNELYNNKDIIIN